MIEKQDKKIGGFPFDFVGKSDWVIAKEMMTYLLAEAIFPFTLENGKILFIKKRG